MENEQSYYCLKAYGVELLYVKNSTFEAKKHNHVSAYLIHMVLNGAIVFRHDAQTVTLRQGELLCVKPYEAHALETKGRYDLFTLVLPLNLLRVRSSDEVVRNVSRILAQCGEFVSLTPTARMKMMAAIQLLYACQRDMETPNVVGDAVKQCLANPAKKLLLGNLAQAAGFDKFYYVRLFKQNVGITPHQFQMQNRIREAKRLIEADVSLTETALAAGFCDQSHFIHCFKAALGISPKVYRASLYQRKILSAQRGKKLSE